MLVMMMIFSIEAFAGDISSFETDSSTHWSKYLPGYTQHMGSKNSSYQYASLGVKTAYKDYVEDGIGLWESFISCDENTSSAMGEITVSASSVGATAATQPYVNPSTNHVSSWVITIYSMDFDGNPEKGKIRTIAHEIGHVYGLGHVSYSNQIMYDTFSTSKNVTSHDKAGMNVMTHTHTHGGSYYKTYEQYTNYVHKVRCNTCSAYYLDSCSFTSYHSGESHYFCFNCVCGNNQTLSWPCSGNPCVTPFSVPPHHEIE